MVQIISSYVTSGIWWSIGPRVTIEIPARALKNWRKLPGADWLSASRKIIKLTENGIQSFKCGVKKHMINVASTSLHAATASVMQVVCWWLHASKTSLCMRTGYVKWNKPRSVSWHSHAMFRSCHCARSLCKICLICDEQIHAITMQFIHRIFSNMMTEFGMAGLWI